MTFELPSDLSYGLFIDGESVRAESDATFATPNPATGDTLAEISAASAADVDRAVRSARGAFESGVWSHLPPAERGTILNRFADLIEENTLRLAQVEAIDAGKPIADCRDTDLPDVVDTFRFYAQAADKAFGKVAPTGPDALGYIVKEPMGVVGAVLPWNFPASMLSWKLAPALAMGNSVVVKPPELASLTTLMLAELAIEAGIPAGVFNVVPGLGEVAGQALGRHDDVDLVTFTGSVPVGRKFLQYSSESNLKDIVLELGGKSAQIVAPSWKGDLGTVAEDLAEAAFGNNGQNCTAGSLIVVHESLEDELLELLTVEAEKRTVGDPREESTAQGTLIERKALDRVLGYIEGAKAEGARIVTGGEQVLKETGGWFVSPTVIAGVTSENTVAQEEIFGPVATMVTYTDDDDALRIANGTKYGLAGTVWSKDVDQTIRLTRGFRAGNISVNGYSEGDMTTPFGGYKQSGFGGRDNGMEALDQYTQTKTIWYTVR